MTIGKRTTTALSMGAAIGGLMLLGLPAEAATHQTHRTGHPNPACTYHVTHLRPGAYVDVRSGPGTRFQPLSTLTMIDGRFRGACYPVKGWVEVTSSTGKNGWVPAQDLQKVRNGRHAGHLALRCAYRVTHVRPGSFLNVRSLPGTRSRRVGKLKVSDGRFRGTCTSVRGWVAVKSPIGTNGWSSVRYLRKTTTM